MYYNVTFFSANTVPEKNLWYNVILRAYLDINNYIEEYRYISNIKVRRQRYIEARGARNWFLSPCYTPKSFIWCTHMCFKDSIAPTVVKKLKDFATTSDIGKLP